MRAVHTRAIDDNGLTLVELEELCKGARALGAPDDARLGVVVKMSMKQYAPVAKGQVEWSEGR